ncbi:uncharacterized protein KNAG_0I01150 [Huiozyma naganishii CBS 8797]|uniref:Uncharacterized protein n=1 Tax=Huiozyma naganishii (strain ATCC MYA-139 / BCRC 22969 / CBS 8797 / KCTC 17520 / NBRC 10181 / NCYC 3082 / Yp74L-3) TaxID=1071383 RepID=J7SA47_HUIN7|nr:hypothetical protein KNAG_0I01150 [Kazachstania naganishii CBS 8797]CCK71906.1 hypothetical protein KNAG_0I01150 [Kazachstania naganishii CBS 8797]
MLCVAGQLVSCACACVAVHYQKRYNRLHRSIYGLSYDTQSLTVAYRAVSVYCSLLYKCNGTVRGQLTRRWPRFYALSGPGAPVQPWIVLADLAVLASLLGLIRQLAAYNHTRHVHQGYSFIAWANFTLTLGALGVGSLLCALWRGPRGPGLLGLFLLDHVNFTWVIGQYICAVALWPQICINWMGTCCSGISSRFVVVSLVGALVRVFTNTNVGNNVPFYRWPYNVTTRLANYIELVSLCIILLQAQKVYVHNKPRLPKVGQIQHYNGGVV